MSNLTVVEDLMKVYGLDVLEIEQDSIYLHCGRGLSMDDFNKLGADIKLIVETIDESI